MEQSHKRIVVSVTRDVSISGARKCVMISGKSSLKEGTAGQGSEGQ
jgi:hypothetical protein